MGTQNAEAPLHTSPDALMAEFFSTFPSYSTHERQTIAAAWKIAADGCAVDRDETGAVHPFRVAAILAQNNLDADCIAAGIVSTMASPPPDTVTARLGKQTARLVTQTVRSASVHDTSRTLQQADAIRKMLFAMVDDVRVILIKLADRLDHLRNAAAYDDDTQRSLAAEALDIWAPLADRLGMQEEKNEFEDLSLKYSNPDVFQHIKAIVAQKKDERAGYLEKAAATISRAAEQAGITVTVKSRAKHFYSSYQKMRKRNVAAGALYDLLALRLICSTAAECYTLIGIAHSLWKPIDGRFKDYIAMPKANGYQSLHTTVLCADHPLEIQIRTEAMHATAEHGVASHWLYKKGTSHDSVQVDGLALFNKIRELKAGHVTDETFFTSLKTDLLGDEIYVFTPKGDVVELPAESTAIDFAYHIHSAIGEKIVGAKADGKIIPLTKPLKNTQIIEVLTNPQAHPTAAQLESVRTAKAKQKIRAWLTAHDESFSDKSTAKTDAAPDSPRHPAAKKRHLHGRGAPETAQTNTRICIGDTTNFFITLAQCCKPRYPDAIVGYVSRTRGVTIHRADCRTYLRIPDIEHRTVDVAWDIPEEKTKKK